MRTLAYFTLAAAVSANSSTMQEIERQIENMARENPEDYGWMLPPVQTTQQPPQMLRTLLEPGREEGTTMNKLNGYGCWCNFDDYKEGFGSPVDDIDTSCKRLHDNYKCIEEEFAAEGQECFPSQIEYISEMLFVYIGEAMQSRENLSKGWVTEAEVIAKKIRFEEYCMEKNEGNRCMQEACLAEAHFLYEISPMYYVPMDMNPDGLQSQYHHSLGGFDTQSQCRTKSPGGIVTEPQCCGRTPNRIRYRNGRKNCCESSGQIYNMMHQCCNDSGVFAIGHC